MSENNPSTVIRITKEEALSDHVDDLLKRQMSLRGEPGVTRDRRKKWYYQNWLVLALAGTLGAILAWAVLEPFFDDYLYMQGEVSDLNLADSLPLRMVNGGTNLQLLQPVEGSFRLKGEKFYLLRGVQELHAQGGATHFNIETLRDGDAVGVYVDYNPGTEQDLTLVRFVVPEPPKQSSSRASMPLRQLQARKNTAAILMFALVAGMIGLFVGAADGLVCRLPRRALLAGGVGLLIGCIGGFFCNIFANLVYTPLNNLAMAQFEHGGFSLSGFGFLIQLVGRSLAWCVAGMAMGLGQGIALRSRRLLLYGLIGGIIGGLFGGLLFDPIDLILLGPDKPSAHWSRLIGFAVIGASVGGLIGIVELLARDSWLRMTQGPLMGKEFLLFKDVMTVGSSPHSDIYLFNDPKVEKEHAIIRGVGDQCEIEALGKTTPLLLNNRPVQHSRLRHGDNVTIGRTSFVYQQRKG